MRKGSLGTKRLGGEKGWEPEYSGGVGPLLAVKILQPFQREERQRAWVNVGLDG